MKRYRLSVADTEVKQVVTVSFDSENDEQAKSFFTKWLALHRLSHLTREQIEIELLYTHLGKEEAC